MSHEVVILDVHLKHSCHEANMIFFPCHLGLLPIFILIGFELCINQLFGDLINCFLQNMLCNEVIIYLVLYFVIYLYFASLLMTIYNIVAAFTQYAAGKIFI